MQVLYYYYILCAEILSIFNSWFSFFIFIYHTCDIFIICDDFLFLWNFYWTFWERGKRKVGKRKGGGRGVRLSQTPNNQPLKLQYLV